MAGVGKEDDQIGAALLEIAKSLENIVEISRESRREKAAIKEALEAVLHILNQQ